MKQFFKFMQKQDPFYRIYIYSIIFFATILDILFLIGIFCSPIISAPEDGGFILSAMSFILLGLSVIIEFRFLADWAFCNDVFEDRY